jgi:acyl-CoA thioesterase-1
VNKCEAAGRVITMLIATVGAYRSYPVSGNRTAEIALQANCRISMTALLRPLHAHRIVCVGDSITEGFANPNNWPYRLKSRLDEDWDVVNLGVGGAFTGYMLSRIDSALDLNPQFVIILGGTNDLLSGKSLERIQVNIDAICTRVESYGSIPVLCTVTPTSDYIVQLTDLNTWITEYARLRGYAFIDFYAVINNESNPGRADPTLVLWDGTHPNATGYAAMGDAIDLGIFTGGNRNSL